MGWGRNETWDEFEQSVHEELESLLIRKYGTDNAWVLSNMLFFHLDGSTTQIDHIIICPGGIYCVEDKNFRGWIIGNHSWENWTNSYLERGYKNPLKSKFRNPMHQNNGHIVFLHRSMKIKGFGNIIKGIVVFPNDAEFKDFSHPDVLHLNELYDFVESLPLNLYDNSDKHDSWLEAIAEFHNVLKGCDHSGNPDAVEKHIENVQLIAARNGNFGNYDNASNRQDYNGYSTKNKKKEDTRPMGLVFLVFFLIFVFPPIFPYSIYLDLRDSKTRTIKRIIDSVVNTTIVAAIAVALWIYLWIPLLQGTFVIPHALLPYWEFMKMLYNIMTGNL